MNLNGRNFFNEIILWDFEVWGLEDACFRILGEMRIILWAPRKTSSQLTEEPSRNVRVQTSK